MTDMKIIPAYDRLLEVRSLFSEYTKMLVDKDRFFEKYLAIQHYDEEFMHLEDKYGMPDGRLYVAYDKEELAGCIALRKIDAERCEMKRLYVREKFRGRQIGKKLVQKIIEDAKEIGYSSMLLDTLPCLESAIKLYANCGFYEIACYNDSPVEDAVYMQLDLL